MTTLNPLTKFFAVLAVVATCSVTNAQEEAFETLQDAKETVAVQDAKETVALQEDGSLAGNVFVAETAEKLADAKMTLSQDGQVISTVSADEEGNFAFQNIEPGSYDLLGSSAPFVGQSSFDVAPFETGGCSACSLGVSSQPSEVIYDSYTAPAESFSASPCNACSSCGCGGGGGGLFGGSGGGGLLGGGGSRLPLVMTMMTQAQTTKL